MPPPKTQNLDRTLATIEEILPLESAMTSLVGFHPVDAVTSEKVRRVLNLSDSLMIEAGLWLYLDDFENSHQVAQSIESPIGAYWHGIIHRREGDFWNSKYWFRQAGAVKLDIAGYEPINFVDAVQADQGAGAANLLRLQRLEWMALFSISFQSYVEKIGGASE